MLIKIQTLVWTGCGDPLLRNNICTVDCGCGQRLGPELGKRPSPVNHHYWIILIWVLHFTDKNSTEYHKIKYNIIGVLTWILHSHIEHGSVACSRCFSPQESRGRQYWSRRWSPLTCAIHQEVIHRRLGRRTLDEQIFWQEIYESFSDPRSHLLGNGSPEIDIQHAWNKS